MEESMKKSMKKMIALLMAACVAAGGAFSCAGALQVQAEANLTDGLVGYWKFDGDTETARLANSVSGTNVTAEKSGSGVTLKSGDGISGGSAYFSKAANSYIKLNLKDAGKGLNSSTDDFTFCAWVKYDDGVLNGDKINLFQQTADASNTGADGRTILYLNTNRKYGSYLNGADAVCDNQTIALNSWHHVAVTYDHDAKKMQFYINGSLAEESVLNGTSVNAATDILVGIHKNMNAVGAVKGHVDELRYYNKVVNADTVKALYDEFGATESPQAVITIEVDTKDEVREIPSAMFGINHRYHKDGYGSWDTNTNAIAEAFDSYSKEANFGSVRYPGGTVSNLFTWKDTIGPLEERQPTIAGNNFYSNPGEIPVNPVFGVDEAMKWIYDDLGSEAIFVYGLGRGNPQDAADLVEYLNAPNDGSNPNGGVDWAAERAKNGHEEPYGVVRFELGNEFSDTGQDYWMAGKGNRSAVDAYINGGVMTYTAGQRSYYQNTTNVAKKADWRAAASNSDGKPNEERYVYYVPVVEDSATVSVAGSAWQIVDSLEGQGAANVCTFDYETGKITFGDGIDGNIPAAGAKITCTYQSRQAGFVEYYDAMKEVAGQIGTEIEIYSGIVDRLQKDFISQMNSQGYNDKYDGVIIHPYTSFSNAGQYEESLATAKAKTNYVASHKDAMMATTGDDRKKVAISEFGINTQSNYVTSLGTAIYVANHMVDGVNAGAAYQNKHCLVDFTVGDNLGAWQQCVIQCHNSDNGYQYVATPTLYLFSIFNHMTGNVQVNQTITGNGDYYTNGNNTVQNINVYSTKDDQGNTYVLVINNKKSDTSSIQISVDGRDLTGEEVEVWDLSSENVDDMNTLAEPDKVTIGKTSISGEGTELEYTLPAHSVTSFKIPAEKANVSVTAEAGGSAAGSTQAVPGSQVTVTATPDENYEFTGWYLEGEKVSDQAVYTFTVTVSVELTAKFTKKQETETPSTEAPPAETEKPVPREEFGKGVEKTVGAGRYRVTNEKKKTAKLVSVLNKKASKLNVPATVRIGGVTCKVTEVGSRVMMGNTKLKKVILGTNVTMIGKQAFTGCKNLKNVQLKGKALKTIRTGAFQKTSAKLTVSAKRMTKKQKAALLGKLKKAGAGKKAKVK